MSVDFLPQICYNNGGGSPPILLWEVLKLTLRQLKYIIEIVNCGIAEDIRNVYF